MTALTVARPSQSEFGQRRVHDNSDDEIEDVNVFFRFADGKNMTLSLSENTEIGKVKKMLIQKDASTRCLAVSLKVHQLSMNKATGLLNYLWFAEAHQTTLLRSNDLFLMFHGKPMDDDDDLLSDYGITRNSHTNRHHTVFVNQRVRGGCFMVSASVLALIGTAIVGSMCTCGMSLLVVPVLLPLLLVLPLCCL